MGAVWELDLPGNEQMLLLCLADHADHKMENIYPSNGLVAWKLGLSEDTVSRLKKRLEERGVLVLMSAAAGRVKCYRMDLENCPRKPEYRPGNRAGNCSPTPPQIAAPRKLHPPAGRPATPPQIADDHIREPSIEPSVHSQSDFGLAVESDHTRVIREFCEAYRIKHGTSYKFSGRDAKAVKELLSVATAEKIGGTLLAAWSSDGWRCKKIATLIDLSRYWNDVQHELTKSRQQQADPNAEF